MIMNIGSIVIILVTLSNHVFCSQAQKIAIIGGGISGTFCAKYLVDYDVNCQIESLTIYDPNPLGRILTTTDGIDSELEESNEQQPYYQGSRIAPLRLKNGKMVELGASIGYKNFKYVIEMAESGDIEMGKPFTTSSTKETDATESNHPNKRSGMIIYDGSGSSSANNNDESNGICINTAVLPKPWYFGYNWTAALEIGYRYNVDAMILNSATTKMEESFLQIHDFIDNKNTPNETLSDDEVQRYIQTLSSPSHLWDYVGLLDTVNSSLDEVCDKLGLSRSKNELLYQLRQLLFPGQGILRDELLSSINLVNYNQDVRNVNGISGMGSFAASKDTTSLFSIVGGNSKLISSAYEQAQASFQRKGCAKLDGSNNVIRHEPLRIDTIVGRGLEGFDLYSHGNGTLVGHYDIVILAVPISMANIEFLISSPMDSEVIQPMPLGGLVQPHHSDDHDLVDGPQVGAGSVFHDGHPALPRPLPKLVTRPYTQVVTTIVSGAELQYKHFGLASSDEVPRGIYMTGKGKKLEHNITAIAQISAVDQIYKVFSNDVLSRATLELYFGPSVVVEFVKKWGGQYGGATPDYQGQGISTHFLLYDGATGHVTNNGVGALYYPNAMEATFACMELCAVGSKAVAKLVAMRSQWWNDLSSNKRHSMAHEEL